jgi:L-2-hydroxyglutarate oxidase
MVMEKIDAVVIGAGAVGISTAYNLASAGVSVTVLEKESGPALHQSGRNSGVIHAGYNPKPGSLKAEYCVEGNRQLREYCQERSVPIREGGILIVARSEAEMVVIDELARRGQANGTAVRILGESEIQEVEPHASGIGALQAADGASFDSRAYVHALAGDASNAGANLFYDTRARSIKESGEEVVIETNKGRLVARVAINAAGLYADELADELADDMRVIPFRGYYAELAPGKTDMINSHVYAAPDLDFPFLGVHLSKKTDGRVIVGPGAMLAFGREAYEFGSFKGGRLGKTLGWPGFYRMMQRPEFQKLARTEIKKSLMIRAIAKEAMQLVPKLEGSDLVHSYAGNRAQLVDKQGNLVDDIVVRETDRSVHVLNAVSPGLTCSLPFGKDLAARAIKKL